MPDPWLDRLLDFALSPALWLALLLAVCYSVLFTAWRGGWRQLPLDLVAGLIGFGIGQLAGNLLGLRWLRVGEVQLLWGTLGSVGVLLLGRSIRRRLGWFAGPPDRRGG